MANAPVAMVVLDQRGVIRTANHLMGELFGYDSGKLVGEHIDRLIEQPYGKVLPERRSKRVAGRGRDLPTNDSLELTGRRRDGTEFPVSISTSSTTEGAGNVVLAATIRDVSERREEYLQLQRLASVIQNFDEAIFTKTLDSIIMSWNPAAERMFGYAREEIIGKPVTILVDEGRHDELADILAKAKDGRRTERYETVRIRSDGKAFPMVITVAPIHDATGAVIGSSTIARDVTKQQQAFDSARSMMETSRDSLVSISPAGRIIDLNEATTSATGFSREEMIGTSFSDYFTEPDRAEAIFRRVFTEGMVAEYPLSIRHPDGTVTEVLYYASVYRDADGDVLGVFAAARDVTPQKEAFDAARSMIEASLDSLVSISPEGRITDVNEATIKATGVPRQELIGTAFSDYFTEPAKADAVYQRVFAEGMAVDYPLTIRHRDGRLTEVLYNASVFRDVNGEVLGAFAAARDVTKQRHAQAEIAQQLDQEVERRAELERFQRLTVGRELRMIELKKEIESLRRYALGEESGPAEGD
jgi:PAS domain S-box-containing protein